MRKIFYIIILSILFLSGCDSNFGDRGLTGKGLANCSVHEIISMYYEFLIDRTDEYSPFLLWKEINKRGYLIKEYEMKYKLRELWLVKSINILKTPSICIVLKVVIDGKNQTLVVRISEKDGLLNAEYKCVFIKKPLNPTIYKNLIKVYDESRN